MELLETTHSPPCSLHRDKRSGWRCTECRRWMCEACAVEKVLGSTVLPACGKCGAAADEVRVRRPDPGLKALLRDVVRYPFTDQGKPLVVTTLVLMGFGLMWWPGRLMGFVVLAGVLFEVVRATGRGERTVPGHFEFADFFVLVSQGLSAAFPFLLWGLLTAMGVGASELLGVAGRAPGHLLVAAGLLVGAGWAAATSVFVSLETNLEIVANPFVAARWWARAWRGLWSKAFVFAVFALLWFRLQVLGDEIVDRTNQWIWPHLLLEPVRVAVAVAAARAAGWMLYLHGADTGFKLRANWYDAALGAVTPTRRIEVQVEAQKDVPPEVVQPIEFDDTPFVPQPFQEFQPTDPGNAIAFEDAPAPGRVLVPPAAVRGPAVEEDLVGEEEFLESVGMAAPKKP